MGLLTKIGLAIPVTVGNAITSVVEKVTGKKAGRTTIKEASETTVGKIIGGGIVASGSALALPAAPAAVTTGLKTAGMAVIQQAVKTPLKTIGIAAVVAGGGLKLIEPAFEATKSATERVVSGGSSGTTTGDVLKVAGVALGAGAIGGAIGGVIDKIKENKSEITGLVDSANGILGSSDNLENAGVMTPQTQELTSTTPKKRKKSRSKAQQSKISQSVRVYVNSNNKSSKRYLNVVGYR